MKILLTTLTLGVLIIITLLSAEVGAKVSNVRNRLQSFNKLKIPSKSSIVPEPIFKRSRVPSLKLKSKSSSILKRPKRQIFFPRPGSPVPTSLEVVAKSVRAKVVHGVKGNEEFPSRAAPVAIRRLNVPTPPTAEQSSSTGSTPRSPHPQSNDINKLPLPIIHQTRDNIPNFESVNTAANPDRPREVVREPSTEESSIKGFKFNDGTDKIIFIDLSELREAGFQFEDISDLSFTGISGVTAFDDVMISNLREAESTLNQRLSDTSSSSSTSHSPIFPGIDPAQLQQHQQEIDDLLALQHQVELGGVSTPDISSQLVEAEIFGSSFVPPPNAHRIDLASSNINQDSPNHITNRASNQFGQVASNVNQDNTFTVDTSRPTVSLNNHNQFSFNSATTDHATDNSLETLEAIKQAKRRSFGF